jgi:hypothetical protein
LSSLYRKVNLHDSNLESPNQPGISVRFFKEKKKPARRRIADEFETPPKDDEVSNDYVFDTSTPQQFRPLPRQPGWIQPLEIETSFGTEVPGLQYTQPTAPMYSPPIAKTAKPWSILIINKYRAMLSMQTETEKYYWVPYTMTIHSSDGTPTPVKEEPSPQMIANYKMTIQTTIPVTLQNVIEISNLKNIQLDPFLREFYIIKSKNIRKYMFGFRKYDPA